MKKAIALLLTVLLLFALSGCSSLNTVLGAVEDELERQEEEERFQENLKEMDDLIEYYRNGADGPKPSGKHIK